MGVAREMEATTALAVLKIIGDVGVLGLGWVLFFFMMFREVRERRRYSDLVIHIITYFTKVNMVERKTDETPLFPESVLGNGGSAERIKSFFGRRIDPENDEGPQDYPPGSRRNRPRRG